MNLKKVSILGALVTLAALVLVTTQAFASSLPPQTGAHEKERFQQRVGTVTAYDTASSITIRARDGKSYTFGLSEHVKILPPGRKTQLMVGSLVTIVARRDPRHHGSLRVFAIVVHPDHKHTTPTPTLVPTETATPLPTGTPTATLTPSPTATGTATPTETATP